MLLGFGCFGQGWGWKAQQSCGTNRNESSICCSDKWNNVYVGGYATGRTSPDSIGFGSSVFYNTPYTNWQIVIAKYDSAGHFVWATASSNGTAATLSNMTTDTAGNMYLFGTFWSDSIRFGTQLLLNTRYDPTYAGSENNSCYFIIKFDPTGSIIWAKTGDRVYNAGLNQAGGIATDQSGNVYISSIFIDSIMHIGSFTFTNPEGNIFSGGKTDIFVAKYDSSGNVTWAKNFRGTGNDYVSGMSVSSDGKIYLTGYYYSPSIAFGSTTLTYPGSASGYPYMFVSRLDTAGNVLWAKGAAGLAVPYAITTDKDNSIYVGGGLYDTAFSVGTFSFNQPHINRSGFLTKYDTSGNVTWVKVIRPMSSPTDSIHIRDAIFSAVTDRRHNIWISGQMTNDSTLVDSSAVLHALPVPGETLMTMMVGYSSSGELLQYMPLQIAMANNYSNSFLASDNAGNLYLSGTYAGSKGIIAGDTLYRNPDDPIETIFTAKYYPNLPCDTLTLSVPGCKAISELQLYPNPATQSVIISATSKIETITIFNLIGQSVFNQQYNSQTVEVDVADFLPGVYFIRVNNIEVRKFVKH